MKSSEIDRGEARMAGGESIYAFGQFRLTPAKRLLQDANGRALSLRDKSYDLLWYLLQHRGRLVSKAELLEALWPDTIVEDNNLNQTISALRQALNDEAKSPNYIATVTGRGYQFVGHVEVARESTNGDSAFKNRESVSVRRWSTWLAVAAASAALIFFATRQFPAADPGTLQVRPDGTPPSIAVLPFENRSADDNDVFFVEGIHDDILTSLAKIGSIKIISRTSVAQFAEPDRVMPQIAEALGVSAVLEGAVQRAGDRVRINVQLIDAATDAHMWAETYDRELTATNIFAIQSEIANTIATAMHAELTTEEKMRIFQVPTDSLEAYEAYLLGKQKLQKRTAAALLEARAYFEDSIERDPNFALAHVGLADSYLILLTYSNRPWSELEPPARAAIEQAIALDPALGEAYATLAMINTESGNHDIAGKQFQRAVDLSPNYATAYQWYASHYGRTRRTQEALAQMQNAVRLDPLSPIIRFSLGSYHVQLGNYDAAKLHLRKAIEIDPGFARANWGLSIVHQQVDGQLSEAAIHATRAALLDPAVPSHYTLLASIYLDLGDEMAASQWLEKAAELNTKSINYVVPQLKQAIVRDDVTEAARLAESHLNRFPRSYVVAQPVIDDLLRTGRAEDAAELLGARFPEFLSNEDTVITNGNLQAATAMINVLQRSGQPEKARQLIDHVTEFMESPSFTGPAFFRIADVQMLALQGKKTDALRALRQHAEAGWRFNSYYYLHHDLSLESIRDEPEFADIVDYIRADIAAQRASLSGKMAAEFPQ